MSSVLGICNLHDCPRLGRLTAKRSIGSVTFLGRYGIIDFALSNFSNSEIDKVAILVENYSHSIRTHVLNGTAWINNTKTGFQKILYNENQFSSPKFNTDINNILFNKQIVDDIESDYVIIASPFFLASMDYRPMLKQHIKSKNQISVVYTKANNADEEYENCDTLEIKDGVVVGTGINDKNTKNANISLETFIVNRKTFDEIIDRSRSISSIFSFRRTVEYLREKGELKLTAVPFSGFIAPILSFENYVKYSFAFLDYSKRSQLFLPDWPIYTTSHNTPPALYGDKAVVSNSFIANGSMIKGTVKNSVISRDVIIEEGAVVEDCILFTKTKVSAGSHLKNVVTDKQVKIINSKNVQGEKDNMMFVDFGEII